MDGGFKGGSEEWEEVDWQDFVPECPARDLPSDPGTALLVLHI